MAVQFTIHSIPNVWECSEHLTLKDVNCIYVCLRNVFENGLHLMPFHDALLQLFPKYFDMYRMEYPTTRKFDIKIIFDALRDDSFYSMIPKYYNGKETKYQKQLIQAALICYAKRTLTCKDIKMALYAHKLREVELLSTGIPFDVDDPKNLEDLLVIINKTINRAILREWLKVNHKAFECPISPKTGFLLTHELLYLLQNCQNRQEMFENIDRLQLANNKNERHKLYRHIPNRIVVQYRTPKVKIQHIHQKERPLKSGIWVPKESFHSKRNPKSVKRMEKIKGLNIKSKKEFNQFKSMLRDEKLIIEIKTKLKSVNQILNYAKLNGRSIRDQVYQAVGRKHGQRRKTGTQSENIFKATQPQTLDAESLVEQVLSNKHYLDHANKRPLTVKVRQFEKDVLSSKQHILDEYLQQQVMQEQKTRMKKIHNDVLKSEDSQKSFFQKRRKPANKKQFSQRPMTAQIVLVKPLAMTSVRPISSRRKFFFKQGEMGSSRSTMDFMSQMESIIDEELVSFRSSRYQKSMESMRRLKQQNTVNLSEKELQRPSRKTFE